MTLARRLLASGTGTGTFAPPAPQWNYSMLYNGQTGGGTVSIGLATSTDAGATWTRYGSNPVMAPGAAGQWDDVQTHAPRVLWDGSQWVMYYGGYDGSNYRIGRATSADLISWTKYASNPVLNLGAGGAFDDNGVVAPTVLLDGATWRMWYVGFESGGPTTMGYADSSDGLSWTKRGQVLDVGTAGQFDDAGVGGGPVVKVGSTFYVFYAGQANASAPVNYRTGYATCTDPATAATYAKQGIVSAFSGNITSMDDGNTYTSNGLISIVERGSQYIGYGTTFHPSPAFELHEVSFRSTSTDLVNWTTPTGELLPLAEGTFDTISAENPSVVAT